MMGLIPMARIGRVVLPILIVAGGVGIARALIASRPEAPHHEVEVPITFVDVIAAQPGPHRVVVSAMGIVRAEREVVLQPEVGGRVIEQNTALVPGGHLGKGDPLIRVDPSDYSAAIAASQAELAQAQLQAREEATLRKVAEHEWRDRPAGFTDDSLAFALREPHMEAAEARISSAKSRIDKARRDLKRTVLRAPFDAVVIDETVDLGQIVGPQTPVARLAGIQRFWVQVAIPVAQLAMLEVPGTNTDAERGSTAKVIDPIDVSRDGREGHAIGLLGSVDERGRMAQVLVAVDDPLQLRKPVAERGLPLLIGRYVDVELVGRELRDVIGLPRQALHEDRHVWIVDGESRLRRREVEVAWRERGTVYVGKGLQPGDRIVVTPLAIAVDGMKVTVSGGDATGRPKD